MYSGQVVALVKYNPFVVQGFSFASLSLVFLLEVFLIVNNLFLRSSDNLYADQMSRDLQLPYILSSAWVLAVCLE